MRLPRLGSAAAWSDSAHRDEKVSADSVRETLPVIEVGVLEPTSANGRSAKALKPNIYCYAQGNGGDVY